ncbi:MAG: response regulator [Methanomicrobiaceae archaeon]|nr:response regulator [Methanomicrobiaceae archaeon]
MKCARILLMDDEAPILDIMTLFLIRNGYDIVCHKNGSEALLAFKEAYNSGNGFDMAILDVSVPGDIGAKELLKPMREIDPNIRIVISSGDSVKGAMDDPIRFGFDGSLKKPFRSSDLIKIVEDTLNK